VASQAFGRLKVQELPFFGGTVVVSIPVTASLVCRAMDISPLPEVKIYHRSNSKNEDGNLILGLAWALGLEAAAAFGILGIWNLLHLLR
jgi:hypothetical protein